jgi:RNA methyltransferase, TrmH family
MLTKSQIKYIQSLNQKKFREENGVFIAEGPKIINELLAAKHIEPVAIYATAPWWRQNDEIKNEVPFVHFAEISESELSSVSSLSTPNQVIGIFKRPVVYDAPDYRLGVTLLLDNIQDPGNMGTIIRIADWFAITHIVTSPDSADVYNPKVVQASMGSIARVHVLSHELKDFIEKYPGIAVYAATLNGKPLQDFGKVRTGFLVVGNESKGISETMQQLATHHITIPKYGEAESLNAAVATGIILSHII